MIVIADTTPLNYLALVGVIEVLTALYGAVVIPAAVAQELQAENVPDTVKEWLASAPAWLEIRTVNQPIDISLEILDAGEREAIQLAEELGASLLIIDEKPGRAAAEARNLKVTGTLGVIGFAAERGLLDFVETLNHLQQTNFHISPTLIRELSDRYAPRKMDEE